MGDGDGLGTRGKWGSPPRGGCGLTISVGFRGAEGKAHGAAGRRGGRLPALERLPER